MYSGSLYHTLNFFPIEYDNMVKNRAGFRYNVIETENEFIVNLD